MHLPRSTRCCYECRPPFGFFGRPCINCAEQYEEWMDDTYKLWAMALADAHANEALPATDRERLEWLDQVAPIIPTTTEFTFTCFT